MRQAVLMTVYKNAEQIIDIINFLGNDFEFYIHIDKKCDIKLTKILDKNNVHIYKIFTVNWGSINHLKSILFLSRIAVADKENYYFHLITGQDFPVKSVEFFLCQLDTGKNYLEYVEMPSNNLPEGGMDRIEYYHPYELFDRKTLFGEKILDYLFKFQKLVRIKRKLPYDIFHKLYIGSTYWSLTRDSLQYVLDFTKNNENALRRMKYTICSEEIYFQTILLNSEYAEKTENDNLRYIDWNPDRFGYPAFLDITDFNKIRQSNKIFARKFHEKYSQELKKMLINM